LTYFSFSGNIGLFRTLQLQPNSLEIIKMKLVKRLAMFVWLFFSQPISWFGQLLAKICLFLLSEIKVFWDFVISDIYGNPANIFDQNANLGAGAGWLLPFGSGVFWIILTLAIQHRDEKLKEGVGWFFLFSLIPPIIAFLRWIGRQLLHYSEKTWAETVEVVDASQIADEDKLGRPAFNTDSVALLHPVVADSADEEVEIPARW
jgi:hypothetical protein